MCGVYFTKGGVKILLRSKRNCRKVRGHDHDPNGAGYRFSELFLPGNHRDQVNAVPRGYGEYDIVIPQTTSWTGRSTSVSGRLVRGKLTLYDNNILSRPIMQFYLPGDEDAWAVWEVDENGKETKMDTEARKQESIQDSKEAIAGYNDNDWYLAYVSINDIMDYKDFIEWFQKLSDQKELEWGALWCAVHTEDEDGYSWNQTLVSVHCHPE